MKFERFEKFSLQAAGHDVLIDCDHKILAKPIAINRDKALKSLEYQWYKSIWSDEDAKFSRLRKWIPRFHGLQELPEKVGKLIAEGNVVYVVEGKCEHCREMVNPPLVHVLTSTNCQTVESNGPHHVLMENVMQKYRQPNLLDVKLGFRLYDDFCTDEKKSRATKLAQDTTSGKVGVRFCGMQRWNGKRWKWKREFGRGLTEANLSGAIRSFFCKVPNDWKGDEHGCDNVVGLEELDRGLVNVVLEKVKEIQAMIQELNNVRMYSSSLLICYEGDGLALNPTVHMIDFAHSYPWPDSGKDENYLRGLDNFIALLQNL